MIVHLNPVDGAGFPSFPSCNYAMEHIECIEIEA